MARPWLLLVFAFAAGFSFSRLGVSAEDADRDAEFRPLFAHDGPPIGWHVTDWSEVSKPASEGASWHVEDGILHGSTPRGTWLVSDDEYGDFILDFDFRLGPRGNSDVGIRFPSVGDPAFDGLEIQMVDRRYYGDAEPGADELTGSIYKAKAPSEQVYRPTEWNHYRITCKGPTIVVELNGKTIQDVDLSREQSDLERGDPLVWRPRKGHIGFQELSRGGTHVEIRNAKIRVLDGK